MKSISTKAERRLSVLVDPPTIRRVKILALDDGVSASFITRQALTDYLAKRDLKKRGVSDGAGAVEQSAARRN